MWLSEGFVCTLDFDVVMCSGAALRLTCLLWLHLFLWLRYDLNLDAAVTLRLSVRAVCLPLGFRLWMVPSLDRPGVGSPWLEVNGSSQRNDDGDSGLRVDGSCRLGGWRVFLRLRSNTENN